MSHPAEPGLAIEVERTQFRSLLLQNPNYFGNVETSPFPPVKVIQGNTSFEHLVCVGLNPPYDRLEGVIHVKQDSGYGGISVRPERASTSAFTWISSTTGPGTTSAWPASRRDRRASDSRNCTAPTP